MCNVEGLYNQQIDEDPLKVALNMYFPMAPPPLLILCATSR